MSSSWAVRSAVRSRELRCATWHSRLCTACSTASGGTAAAASLASREPSRPVHTVCRCSHFCAAACSSSCSLRADGAAICIQRLAMETSDFY